MKRFTHSVPRALTHIIDAWRWTGYAPREWDQGVTEMIPAHVTKLLVALCSSIVLTSTVVGPLAYGAHAARLERRIIETIHPQPAPTTTTTSTAPPATDPETTDPESEGRPSPFGGGSEDPDETTLPSAGQPSVLGTNETRETTPGVDSGSGSTSDTTSSTVGIHD